MKFSTIVSALSMAVGLSSALPAPQAFPPVPADTVYYYFKTQVKDYQPAAYDDLYLVAYHTGAGLSDATFVKGAPLEGHRGWFNGTALNWFQPSSVNGGIFFGVDYYVGGGNYASWSTVTINGGQGSPGLGLDDNKNLVVLDNSYWDSWLVCDWWHNVPQLFTLSKSSGTVLPSSCAKVDLVAEVAPPLASATSSATPSATATSA